MDFQFSEIHNGTKVAYSPDGKFIATIDRCRVRMQKKDSMAIVGTRTNSDECNELEWSPDCQFLLCSIFRRKSVQIWSRDDEAFSCTIDEGIAGLTHATWAADSRHVITSSEFQIRLTVWSLEDRKARYIKFPKFSKKGIAPSNSLRYLAVVERREHRDYIGIYSQEFWELIHRFKVETVDLEDCMWSPDDRVICVYDNPVEYQFLIYSPRGRKLAQFQAYENALGIKSISFSPKGRFLAVGSYDQICRVFNNLTWRSLSEYKHTSNINTTSQYKKAVVYQEVFADVPDMDDAKSDNSESSGRAITSNPLRKSIKSARIQIKKNKPEKKRKYMLGSLPLTLKEVKVQLEENPKVGVSRCEWSPSGKYLATMNDNLPHTVWIWNMARLSLLSLVDHKDEVRSFKWAPGGRSERLAICCGNDKLYLWSKSGSIIIRCRAHRYVVRDLQWCPDGESILLMDKSKFCCCYFDEKGVK